MQQSSMRVSASGANLPAGELASIINGCFQCGKCSAGCPVASEMDLLPHQLVRLAVLGEADRIVNSKSIWLCLTCHTCGARCPNGIDVPALLDPIRHQMLKRNFGDRTSPVPSFHTSFMKNVRFFGRVHELSLIGMYKMKTRTFFDDMELGMNMFKKGKIHLVPHIASNVSEVKELFKHAGVK
jgi:heterodisulfide reductase subunit C2